MNEAISNQLVQLSLDALSILLPVVVAILANTLKNYTQNQKLVGMKQIIENKQLIAKDTVLFAQQVYKDCDGEAKYHAAMQVLSTKLERYGLKVPEEELDELIHTALKAAKKEFADVWNTIGEDKPQEESVPTQPHPYSQ